MAYSLAALCKQVLAASRLMVAWQPIGISMGVYDMCHRYDIANVFKIFACNKFSNLSVQLQDIKYKQ